MKEYPFFPLFIDISKKKITVIGGGRIAKRRIEALAQFTGNLTVIAPEIDDDILKLENIGVVKRAYEEGDISDSDIVFAATDDDEVDSAVFKECKKCGILVNVASDRKKSDFYFPGIARKDFLVAGVTASGKDHAQAKKATAKVRECIEKL